MLMIIKPNFKKAIQIFIYNGLILLFDLQASLGFPFWF